MAEPAVSWVLPGETVRVIAPAGGGKRLAVLVRDVLERMPDNERRTVLEYWRRVGNVEIVSSEGDPLWRRGVKGVTFPPSVHFHARKLAKTADEQARNIVAHELAHVQQLATGRRREMTSDEAEVDANCLIVAWGFEQDFRSIDRLRTSKRRK